MLEYIIGTMCLAVALFAFILAAHVYRTALYPEARFFAWWLVLIGFLTLGAGWIIVFKITPYVTSLTAC